MFNLNSKDKDFFEENGYLVKSVLETKRSSKLEKLNKIVNAED